MRCQVCRGQVLYHLLQMAVSGGWRVLEDPRESCGVINAHTFEDSTVGGKIAETSVAESHWLSPAYPKGP